VKGRIAEGGSAVGYSPGLAFKRRWTVIKSRNAFDGELSGGVLLIPTYYIGNAAGFQPVFLFSGKNPAKKLLFCPPPDPDPNPPPVLTGRRERNAGK